MNILRNIGINISPDVIYGAKNFIDCVADNRFNSVFTCGNDEAFISFVSSCCAKNGLTYETLHAPFKGINGLWFEESGQSVANTLIRSLDLASEYGIGIIISHLSSGDNCPTVTDAGLKYFDKVVEYAAKKNIVIAVENQRKLGNISVILEKYDQNTPVQFCWDVGHEKCFAHGREYMPLFGDRCITTHIHDNNMRYNGDEHLIPFDGQINFRRTAELLNRYNYKGTLMLELDLPNENSDKYRELSLAQFVQKAFAAVNRINIISE